MKRRVVFVLIFGCLLTFAALGEEQIQNGDALVRAMHTRYEKNWYATMTFTQKSTTYNPGGATKVDTWYEAGMLPGNLRIDFGPPADGNGVILTDGNAISFKNGAEAGTRPSVNMLLVLGFDVYRQPPETTIAQLKQEGIDLAKIHEETWQGDPVYVTGADKGDLKSNRR